MVIDPYYGDFVGFSAPKLDADIVCITHDHKDHSNVSSVKGPEGSIPFLVQGPGEYEKSGVTIVGVSSYHDDKEGSERGKNTIYLLTIDEINVVHLGDLGQSKLTQEQIDELSSCDILLIPAGGVYTIDAKAAPAIIAALEPKIIVPMHYGLPGLKFDLAPVDDFLKVMGKEKAEPLAKLSVSRDKLPEEPEVVVLAKN